MQFDNFEEVIGKFTGDKSIIKSSIDDIYNLLEWKPNTDGFSNINGWQKDVTKSTSFLPQLREMILQNFYLYLQYFQFQQKYSASIVKLFVNVNPPNAFHTLHEHKGGEFSGAFWLKAESKSGSLFILNPYPNSFLNTLLANPLKSFNTKIIIPEPNTGVFFNSNLIHYVDVNRSSADRISLAYHIKIN